MVQNPRSNRSNKRNPIIKKFQYHNRLESLWAQGSHCDEHSPPRRSSHPPDLRGSGVVFWVRRASFDLQIPCPASNPRANKGMIRRAAYLGCEQRPKPRKFPPLLAWCTVLSKSTLQSSPTSWLVLAYLQWPLLPRSSSQVATA